MIDLQKQQTGVRRYFVKAFLLAILFVGLTSATYAQGPPQGNGVKHQATLTWAPDTGATGFNVYRSTSATGAFVSLTATPITTLTAPSFIDSAVAQGTTYFWCVTALATISTGPFESACSTVVTGTIPKEPTGAPSGVSLAIQ
jgi:hypothetical protein